jgi:fructose-bisphosphate aldolase class 1
MCSVARVPPLSSPPAGEVAHAPLPPPLTPTVRCRYISGAILFEETLFQSDPSGKPFVDVLRGNGIIPGIKVDTGLRPLLCGGEGENWCTGLDSLAERTAKCAPP